MIGQGLEVRAIAADLLASVVAHWAAQTDPDTDALPARRLVLAGEPRGVAWDCEYLAVTLMGIGWGQALDASSVSPRGGSPASVMALRHAVLNVTLVRCTPAGDTRTGLPSDADLNRAGLRFFRDAGLLSQALVEYATRLRPGLSGEALVQPGAVEPIGPMGGFHGLESTFTVTAATLG